MKIDTAFHIAAFGLALGVAYLFHLGVCQSYEAEISNMSLDRDGYLHVIQLQNSRIADLYEQLHAKERAK